MLRFPQQEDVEWTSYQWSSLKSRGLDSSLFHSQDRFVYSREQQGAIGSHRYQILLQQHPDQINPSPETIQKIHQDTFQLIFPQHAGLWRTSEHPLWFRPAATPETIPNELARLHRDFDAELHWAKNQDQNRDAHLGEAIARYHVRFLQVHPFEHGNGTVGRIILSHQGEHFLDSPSLGKWTPIGRLDYAYAVTRAERFGDYKPFLAVFDKALHNRDLPWQHDSEHPAQREVDIYKRDRNIRIEYGDSPQKTGSIEHQH